MSAQRPSRPHRLPPEALQYVTRGEAGMPEAELLERLERALHALPPAERTAAIVAIGYDEGSGGVAAELDLSDRDADALTRNALQLLRGALADVDLDASEIFGRFPPGRRGGED